MLGKVYKIVNDINDKIYIGKTYNSLQKRFQEHCRDAYRQRNECRPLYNAMIKYGTNHFFIELIEETIEPENREQYWIQHYHSYEYGYNATRGGDGKSYYDYDAIAQDIQQGLITQDIVNKYGCCADVVRLVAKQSGLSLNIPISNVNQPVMVNQYDMNNNFIQTFNSIADAAKWLYNNQLISTLSSGVRSHISEVCQHKRKSAYKYKWEYK